MADSKQACKQHPFWSEGSRNSPKKSSSWMAEHPSPVPLPPHIEEMCEAWSIHTSGWLRPPRKPSEYVNIYFSEDCSYSFISSFMMNRRNFLGIKCNPTLFCPSIDEDLLPSLQALYSNASKNSPTHYLVDDLNYYYPRHVLITTTGVFPEYLFNQLKHNFMQQQEISPPPLRSTTCRQFHRSNNHYFLASRVFGSETRLPRI